MEIYLDNAATTRPHPAVVESVTRALTIDYGNPSSLHGKGLAAERLVAGARDAVEAWGKMPLRPMTWCVDLMSLSGHKVHGPKGVGALYVRPGVRLAPQLGGGEQERGVRPGTENVPGIAGLGAAARLLATDFEETAARMRALRDRLREQIRAIPDVRINTPPEGAAPHLVNATFGSVRGETLLHRLEQEGVFVSTGSACHTHSRIASHVLLAIMLNAAYATSTLRFSL